MVTYKTYFYKIPTAKKGQKHFPDLEKLLNRKAKEGWTVTAFEPIDTTDKSDNAKGWLIVLGKEV